MADRTVGPGHHDGDARRLPVRLLIVAGVRLYRDGLSTLLSQRTDVTVVGALPAVDQAIATLVSEQPDVVLLDTLTAGALAGVAAIRRHAPAVQIVAFAVGEHDPRLVAFAEAGVAGYVTCDATTSDVVAIVESARRGELFCSPRMAGVLLRRLAALAAERSLSSYPMKLTTREAQVGALIERGLSNKQIARELGIGLPTVKNHVHNILEKLDVHGRGEAAARMRHERASLAAYGSVSA